MMLLKGHQKVKLSQAELLKIVPWVDANCPYFGTYSLKIDPQQKDHPKFRAVPVVLKH